MPGPVMGPGTLNMNNEPTDYPMLSMRAITKRFPGVLANDRVDFDVAAGEVHTLLGENGAGKSTLMKILFGLYQADEGEILLNGRPLEVHSPADAIHNRIGMIHQHFMLVPSLTVAENVALGIKSARRPLTDLAAVTERIEQLSATYGLAVHPDVEVWKLSVGERQRIEIIKALYREVELLVLDEPTAVLTPGEVEDMFRILRQMADDGKGLVFITHKLGEVMALSDRITVMRNGHISGHTTPAETSPPQLAEMMVGREVILAHEKPDVERGETRLELRSVTILSDRGPVAVDGVDLDVHAGEIVGIAGVSGNGQRELAEAIAGIRAPQPGSSIRVNGTDVAGAHPSVCRAAGLAYVPEERMRDGAIGDFSVNENLILVNHGSKDFAKRGLFRFGPIKDYARHLVADFTIKTPTIDTPTKNLSGGNIQKVILARELASDPSVVVASQPTRGVDIGAAEYIHQRLIEQRSEGVAVLMISEDLDEVMGLADRIAVMYEGRILAIVDRDDATREQLGLMMAGVVDEPAT